MPSDERAEEGSSPIWQGLRFRVAALLALSLLPIGLVTMLQTREIAVEIESRAELSLINRTVQATYAERQSIERVFGGAEALTSVLNLLLDEPDACHEFLERYVQTAPRLTFVGFIPPDGIVTCSSVAATLDFSDDPRLEDRMGTPRAFIYRIDNPAVTEEPVLNVMRPVYGEDQGFRGYVTLSLPVARLKLWSPNGPPTRPSSLVTFNREGQILFAQMDEAGIAPAVPRDTELVSLVGGGPRTFDATDQAGVAQRFTVVPLIPNLVYALAAWKPGVSAAGLASAPLSPTLLPFLMFAASIAVAYFAVDRLVVRHVSELRRMMRAFAQGRRLPLARRRGALSSELRELEEGFVEMAIDLANDEARMEDALREKNVLLKEIHHRVKNNLQLISSIMNMQIRAAREDETVTFLRRLQERVLGLSAVHRNLYQAEDLSRTDAGKLLEDLFQQLISLSARGGDGVQFDGEFEGVVLYPDQALPLSLLASELGTNALNHVSSPDGQPCRVFASLRQIGEAEAEFICENTIGPDADRSDGPSHGLGNRLIRAFAAQLGGDLRTVWTDDTHRVSMRFRIESFSQTPNDY